jgi:sRNA-binding protein
MSNKSDPRIIIGILAEKFPLAFFLNGSRRRPLKIGILDDLIIAEPKISRTRLRSALRDYTSSPGYLLACREGAARVDLSGQPAGTVSEEEAQHAWRRAGKNGHPEIVVQRTPQAVATAAGLKLRSLADLAAVWRAKREAAE